MSEGTKRRLAAIVAADVAGYSRLVGFDEEGTLATLRSLRTELIDPLLAKHGGRIANTAGDSLLLEFPSIVDAVRCSIAVQKGMHERNREIDDDQRVEFRVGIHLGDVIAEGSDLLGDGVNVAARLEGLSAPGGMVLSDDAYRQVRDRLNYTWIDDGEHEVKNIVRPVQVWRWAPDDTGAAARTAISEATLTLPDKPSIAVLPFQNMSGDPEQEYFADGIAEDIITALSRLRWLFVISRNSTFTYKGRAVDVRQVGHDMGVRYVLEGSVRKAGKRARVTAQLADAGTGSQIWAERYDRELVDMFDLQDELTASICAQVHVEVAGSERDQAHRKASVDLDAWELYQRGMWHYYKYSKDDALEAHRLFRLATERAPEFAGAFAGLAVAGFSSAMLGYASDSIAILEESLEHAERAVALDDREGAGFYAMGRICTVFGDRDRAIPALRKSVEMTPSSAANLFGLGYAMWWFGMAEEGLPLFTRAIRLSPRDPQLWMYHYMQSLCHAAQAEYDAALTEAKTAIQIKRNEFWPQLALVLIYNALGMKQKAKEAYERGCELNPLISDSYLQTLLATLHKPYWEAWREALYDAGMPKA
jgi:adenylate cyclase